MRSGQQASAGPERLEPAGAGMVAPIHRPGLAGAVTEVLAPANLVIAQLLLIGWHSSPGLAGLGWGLLAAAFCAVIPYAIVLRSVRAGRLTDRHIRARHQRRGPFLTALASLVAGLAVLALLHAPEQLVVLVVALLAGLATTLAVTLWWKISVHTAVVSGSVATLCVIFGPSLLLATPAIPLVAWSRIRLRDHTPAQTAAGAALGALVATGILLALG